MKPLMAAFRVDDCLPLVCHQIYHFIVYLWLVVPTSTTDSEHTTSFKVCWYVQTSPTLYPGRQMTQFTWIFSSDEVKYLRIYFGLWIFFLASRERAVVVFSVVTELRLGAIWRRIGAEIIWEALWSVHPYWAPADTVCYIQHTIYSSVTTIKSIQMTVGHINSSVKQEGCKSSG